MAEWRTLFSPHDRRAAYHGERARGGIGLIVMEGVIPHPTGVALPRLVHAWNDDVIPGFRKIAAAVHPWGAKIFCQYGGEGEWTESKS